MSGSSAEDVRVVLHDLRVIFARLAGDGRAAEAVVLRDAIGLIEEAATRVVISPVALEIALERKRQVEVEGWTAEHDDEHDAGELAHAAASYALSAAMPEPQRTSAGRTHPTCWPWGGTWWKPRTRREDLVRGGALIVAEIERLDRRAVAS